MSRQPPLHLADMAAAEEDPHRRPTGRRGLRRARRRLGTLVVAALASVAAALAGPHFSAGAAAASDCRTRGTTVLANAYARVYALDRGDIEVYACRYTARSIGQHASLAYRGAQNGTSNFRLEGFYVSFRVNGAGCSGSGCVGPFFELVDTRRPRQPGNLRRRLPGTVSALRSDGVFATASETQDGNPPTVRVWDKQGAREVGHGNIPPGSLALGPSAVYWAVDGTPQTAAVAGPVR